MLITHCLPAKSLPALILKLGQKNNSFSTITYRALVSQVTRLLIYRDVAGRCRGKGTSTVSPVHR